LKYDWCSASQVYNATQATMAAAYAKMGEALLHSGRKIVYSLCQYGNLDVGEWGEKVGGNLWRTTGDISDRWPSMNNIGFNLQPGREKYAGPGHWNDPDMLEIGNGAMTDTEYKVHLSLWAMLAAPLIAGNDLRNMSPAIKEILMNREVIAVDQDKEGKQGKRLSKSDNQEVWVRELSGRALAVALFNRSTESANMTVAWSDLGLKKTPRHVRDLWTHSNVSVHGPKYSTAVIGHGVVMLRVTQ
jgi:alpha-galactosidase